jgi:hypothetical protein
MKATVLLIASACSMLAADLAVTDGMSNGRAWKGLGGGDAKMAVMLKFLYVVGLADGLKQGRDELTAGLAGAAASSGQKQLKTAQGTAADVIPGLMPTGKNEVAVMIGALDEFYSDSKNLDIPIPVAARTQKAWMEGTLKDREEHILRLRVLYNVSKELDSLGVK